MQRDGGPGGAGNPVGGSFTGPAQALELIGNHCYAYSGTIGLPQNTETTFAEFTTGNYYSVVDLAVQGNFDSMGSSSLAVNIYLNDAKIVESETSASNDSVAPFDNPIRFIIPAYTAIKITISKADSGTDAVQTLITGRIYRG